MSPRLAVALTPGSFTDSPTRMRAAHRMSLAEPAPHGVVLGRVCPVPEADVALFPLELGATLRSAAERAELLALVGANAAAGLRTLLVLDHDHCWPVDLGQPDAIVLRTSMLGASTYTCEFAMPARVEDPWDGRSPYWRPWSPRPLVGFMGKANPGFIHQMTGHRPGDPPPSGFELANPAGPPVFAQPVDVSGVLRGRALAGLRRSRIVDSSIVVRDLFFGHYDEAVQVPMRAEYAEHLAGSDYVLCIRGAGNYSIRLFETLAMGRVPVLLETDLVLPCADVVDWDAFCVRVPLPDIDRIDQHVAAAHAEGPEAFAWRQRAAREAWERWLSVDGFAHYVADVILADRDGGA